MKRVLLQPAYVLHRRPYRETSFLVELFTPDYGRLSVIAKGARQSRTVPLGLLQPFFPLLVSWAGKGELMVLSQVEAKGALKRLSGNCLFAGFYLNELLICLLQKWDANSCLYAAYEKTIHALQQDKLEEKVLRSFEKYLLEELGYGFLPKTNSSLQNQFVADRDYQFTPEAGWVLAEENDSAAGTLFFTANRFSGKCLLAMAREDWQEEATLQEAKRLIRFVLAPLLGKRAIHSRRLFIQPEEENKSE